MAHALKRRMVVFPIGKLKRMRLLLLATIIMATFLVKWSFFSSSDNSIRPNVVHSKDTGRPIPNTANKSPGTKYCYNSHPNTIIFLRLTDSKYWDPLEVCSIKSAAIANPTFGVCVLTTIAIGLHRKLSGLPNLEMALLNVADIFEDTAAQDWYMQYQRMDKSDKPFLNHDLHVALRYAYLYKYGGMYMETDIVTLKSFNYLHNAIAMTTENHLDNAVMTFDQGHPFLEMVLNSLSMRFRDSQWGHPGSKLLTFLHNEGLVDRTTYKIVNSDTFYPLSSDDLGSVFDPEHLDTANIWFEFSYTMRFQRDVMDAEHMIYFRNVHRIPERSFMANTVAAVCA